MTRDKRTFRRRIKAAKTFVIIRKSKIDARQGARCKFMRRSSLGIGTTYATANMKSKIIRIRMKKGLKRCV
jgi:hypothetical protein